MVSGVESSTIDSMVNSLKLGKIKEILIMVHNLSITGRNVEQCSKA